MDRLCRQHCGERQESSREPFRQAHQVRLDAGLLASEQCACAAKPRGDFIGDQKHTMQVAQGTGMFQVGRVVHAHAAGALYPRLQNQRADFASVTFQ